MEASDRIRALKAQRLDGNHSMNGSGSYSICDLHDPILLHILSFLPFREAWRTCILSKRWKSLRTLSKLKFHQGSYANRKVFIDSVDHVLCARNFNELVEFSLSCEVLADSVHIQLWISAVVRYLKLQRLSLHFTNFKKALVLPYNLFTSRFLKQLDVNMKHSLKLPSSINFPNLGTLTLSHVIFEDDHSTQQLFSACPLLEELELNECNWDNLKAVNISCPNLSKLLIRAFGKSSDDSSGIDITISGTNLKSLRLSGDFRNNYYLSEFSSLVDASLDILGIYGPREVANLRRIMRSLFNVKDLKLSSQAAKVICLSERGGVNDLGLDPLSHLKIIQIHKFDEHYASIDMIKVLLNSAPALDRMVLFYEGIPEKRQKLYEQLLMLPKKSVTCTVVLN